MNFTGLVGIAAPTKNFSVTIGLSLIVFVFIIVKAVLGWVMNFLLP